VASVNPEERPELTQVAELRKLTKIYRKQRSKLHADQLRQWTELTARPHSDGNSFRPVHSLVAIWLSRESYGCAQRRHDDNSNSVT